MNTVQKIFFVIVLLSSLPLPTRAQTPCPSNATFGCFEVGLPGSSELTAGKSIDSFIGGKDSKPILKFIGAAVNVVIAVLVIIGVICVVIGGYMYMTAGGSGDQVKTAKSWIQSALFGIFLALISVVILNTINRYLGSDAQEPQLGTTGAGSGAGGDKSNDTTNSSPTGQNSFQQLSDYDAITVKLNQANGYVATAENRVKVRAYENELGPQAAFEKRSAERVEYGGRLFKVQEDIKKLASEGKLTSDQASRLLADVDGKLTKLNNIATLDHP